MVRVVSVYDTDGKPTSEVEVPAFFNAPVRKGLIKRAVIALQSHGFQPQGRDPMAGKRTSAQSMGVGYGMSRVPRVKGERYQRANLAAFAPGTVKGRLAFPPEPGKVTRKKINRKELRSAFLSALAASASPDLVRARGHNVPADRQLPLIVVDDVETIARTSEAKTVMKSLGLWDDVERAGDRHTRLGRGRMRGRPLKHHVSVLVVVDKKRGVERAFRNFDGVDVVDYASLNVRDLAPGTHPGRLTMWTESALKGLTEKVQRVVA